MKKIKRLVALAMCATITAGVFTGCGKSETTSGDGTVNLIWYAFSAGEAPKDELLIEEELNKYTKEKINATVDIKFINLGDYGQKMNTIVNSGEPFDIMFTCSWVGDYVQNATKGAYIELDQYFDNIAKDMYEEIDERFWEGAKINGKTYAVPCQKEIASVPVWTFTKEYVDKYNVPIEEIETLEDLEPWLKLIKEKEPDVAPIEWGPYHAPFQFMDMIVDPIGIEFDDETLTVKNILETERFIDSLRTVRRYYEAGYISKDANIKALERPTDKAFVGGRSGQPYADGIWSKQFGYEVVSTPSMESYITTTSTRGAMMAVSKASKNPEKAVEFLNLLNTDPVVKNLVTFGVEGVHYDKIGDNQIKLTEKKSGYDIPYYQMGNSFISYVQDNEPVEKWDEFKEFNKKAVALKSVGFTFDPSPVSNEVVAISNVMNEFRPSLYTGSVDVDEYVKKINDKLKDVGIDKVIEEAQKQLDTWAKENGKK